ncbi:MAG: DUF2155 domain-containing protein [Marivibrio sp.]|uniref:DUF2155 domain-containing protein n=1 Tax=Marivibrio sp. TaxID=2039719 RepID=UPI0032EED62B
MGRGRLYAALAAVGLGVWLGAGLGLGEAAAVPRAIAVLQGLDKVTARVSTFEAPVGETVTFGALQIRVRHCDRTPPQEAPESAAFLEIDEVKQGEEPAALFTGWMFASSPGLNALEHPVYDVWVLQCKGAELEGGVAPPSPE